MFLEENLLNEYTNNSLHEIIFLYKVILEFLLLVTLELKRSEWLMSSLYFND